MPISYERFDADTDDGFRLTLFRRAAGPTKGDLVRPVALLLPGMGANRFTFALQPDAGIPAALGRLGWDVWLGEFRGSHSSRFLGAGRPPLTLFGKLERDIPTMRRVIAAHTGQAPISLVGHSLGGLLSLLHAADERHAEGIERIVTLCAPGARLTPAGGLSAFAAAGTANLLGVMQSLRVAPLARVPGPVRHLVALRGHFRQENGTAADRRAYFESAVEDISGHELAELLRWQTTGRFAIDGHAPGCLMRERLGALRVPALGIASTHDSVVPHERSRLTFDMLPAELAEWRLVGRAHGATSDYAHADLLLSEQAEVDLVAPVVNWLSAARRRTVATEEEAPQKLKAN